jgi:hypothetical protein
MTLLMDRIIPCLMELEAWECTELEGEAWECTAAELEVSVVWA